MKAILACAIVIGLAISLWAQESIQLKADRIRYSKGKKIVLAQGNVSIVYKEFEIKTSQLQFDTESQEMWCTVNAILTNKNGSYQTDDLYVDLDQNVITLKHLHLQMAIEGTPHFVFIKAGDITDDQLVQIGHHALLTTCNLPTPHYQIYSEKFRYVPDKEIQGENVWVNMPILGVPFGFWTPYYNYQLGKKKLILNYPVIGKKQTPGWGYFVQTTLDYDLLNGKESSLFVDWFENKGIGLGVKHQYELERSQGYLSYYFLDERDTGLHNQKIEWENTYPLFSNTTVVTSYKNIDAERVALSGRQKQESMGVVLNYRDVGDSYEGSLNKVNDDNLGYKLLSLNVNHQFNSIQDYKLNISQQDALFAGRRNIDAYLNKNWFFSDGWHANTDFKFHQVEMLSKRSDADQSLETNLTFEKELAPAWTFGGRASHFWDMDGDRVTTDIASNRYFYRLPELYLSYTPTLWDFSLQQKMTFGRYQEREYLTQRQTLRVFPLDSDMGVAPNTYIWEQSINRQWAYAPNSSFSFQSGYNQYVFQNPGKDLFSGDAFYTLSSTLKHQTDMAGFVQFETAYTNTQAPQENNSPFYYFNQTLQSQNKVSQKVKFYYLTPTFLYWSHESGYDWNNSRYLDYFTRVYFQPISLFSCSIFVGKKLNPLPSEAQLDYYPFVINAQLYPSEQNKLNAMYELALDTNAYVYSKKIKVQNSRISLGYILGNKPTDQLELSSGLTYRVNSNEEGYALDRYDLQVFQVVKRDHCRTFSFGYNKSTEEYQFKLVIDAFPEDPIELDQTRSVWRFGGKLNQSAQERF